MNIKKIFKEHRGSVIVIVAVSMVALLGFTALSVDVGIVYNARNQLQAAVDSAALAGASGLLVSDAGATARIRANQFAGMNRCINQPVVPDLVNIDVGAGTVQVHATRRLDTWFARVFGANTTTVTATATAKLSGLESVNGMAPWAIPQYNYVLGQEVTLKSGDGGIVNGNNSFYSPVDMLPMNRGTPVTGANEYKDLIINGSDDPIYIGDELQVEPGKMVGPTKQGVNAVMDKDPDAYWDNSLNQIVGSKYTGFSSPRIVIVPFFSYSPDPGRTSIIVVQFGAFFIEGVEKNSEVVGRFIKITTPGPPSQGGGGGGMVSVVHLVQ